MDLAKIAAALATHSGDVDSIVGVDQLSATPLPLILIPTTAGTGSEATRIAMVSLEGRKKVINDARLVPVAAVLDATLVRSAPPAVTATTGMDALCHAIEGALSTEASTLSTNAANEAVSLLARWLPAAFLDGDDIDARQGTMYAAYLAGLALNAGSVLGHSMGYTIAHRTGLPHGATVAMALPFCLAYCADGSEERIADMWARVSDFDDAATDIYDWIARLMRSFGMATNLSGLGLSEQDALEMADECVTKYPRPNNPVPLERERVSKLYLHLVTGDIDACLADFAASHAELAINQRTSK
jgi:alcohol dehydrogenase class IV